MTDQDPFQQIKQIADMHFYISATNSARIRNVHQLIRRTFEQDVPNALRKWQRGDETTLRTHREIKPLIIQTRTMALHWADEAVSKQSISKAYEEREIEEQKESRPVIHGNEDEEGANSNETLVDSDGQDFRTWFGALSNR